MAFHPCLFRPPEDGISSLLIPPPNPPKGGLKNLNVNALSGLKFQPKTDYKVKFRRQHPVDIFVLDFYCHELKLAIEVDGEIHLSTEVREYDEGRTYELEKFGIKILRFTNEQIFENLDEVQVSILNIIRDIAPLLRLRVAASAEQGRGVGG
ncbi:MAG: endonuclease domain-containing protein [Bacteroidales bacterium]|nr:endonuclease domain-containing protein [Bacteroidales bacterium]